MPPPKGVLKEVAPNILNFFKIYEFYEQDPQYIPFWKGDSQMLFIAGAEDQVCKSVDQAKKAEELMENNGKGNNIKLSIHDGLGHLIDLPFSPPCFLSRHALFPRPILIEMGGSDPIKHGKAQEKSWFETIEFFKLHL